MCKNINTSIRRLWLSMGSFMTLIYYGVGDGGGSTAVSVPATAVVLAAALGRQWGRHRQQRRHRRRLWWRKESTTIFTDFYKNTEEMIAFICAVKSSASAKYNVFKLQTKK